MQKNKNKTKHEIGIRMIVQRVYKVHAASQVQFLTSSSPCHAQLLLETTQLMKKKKEIDLTDQNIKDFIKMYNKL